MTGWDDDPPPLTWARVWELYAAEAARIPDPRIYWEHGGALYATGPGDPDSDRANP